MCTPPTYTDFDSLSRLVRLLWSLGDFAFRELIPYMPLIDTGRVPEALRCQLGACAIFLRGRSDRFLYEWLSELSGGDALLPFVCHYARECDPQLLSH